MDETETLSTRIDTLERRLTHQERTIDELSETIAAQWKQIDTLARRITDLLDQVRQTESQADSQTTPELPPPHY